ncbi:hypothetical protein ASPZODRAFT_117712 [Penicilliopsis zonata CBS 506.65]|uniref:NADH:flavin oxidoreductase/NADH oxidase N-terminal domain-containing protein n=1 Tax=Penicilliopsis zonata CBS 506.65 TaxID=1073090 RepID=A0A1L9SFE8_9EURO|nr:hypothetical protein ASPZODRAFT_117712 [Penicilliopsis zonata CBS 506.65]OJJ45995.1 hypothetical protein ASPZODRAFT_117712 [Penicilliopsis zonata CBS 506.65]
MSLFHPLPIANGRILLRHRIVHAPLTRNRGVPVHPDAPGSPNRIWYPGDLMVEYYSQRATEGGLIISEGIPPSLESNGMPGVPGLFTPQQIKGWKRVVEAVHARGGIIYCQLWHAGRATIPQMTGSPAVCPSATPWDNPTECYSHIPVGETQPVRYADYPPVALTKKDIQRVIQEYVDAAVTAMEIVGFDGVEVHAGNGYLPEQFLSSNINTRTDEYGGSPERRARFVLELMGALARRIGEDNLAIRLSPFGLFNQARSLQRMQTWTYLCTQLNNAHRLSYVSFIEPRYEQIFTSEEKDNYLAASGLRDITLAPFRAIWGDTPFFSAGGWDAANSAGVIESGRYDALLYGRYFTSNPDLVERLRRGSPLAPYDRTRFYGPFEDNAVGYTDYSFLE